MTDQAPGTELVPYRGPAPDPRTRAVAVSRAGTRLARRGLGYAAREWWEWVWQPEAARHVKLVRQNAKAQVSAAKGDEQVKLAGQAAVFSATQTKDLRDRRLIRLGLSGAVPVVVYLVGLPVLAGGIGAPLAVLVLGVLVLGVLVLGGYVAGDDEHVAQMAAAEVDPTDPFPLADARRRADVQECFRRALEAEGVKLRTLEEPSSTGWGWEQPIVLKAGSVRNVSAKVADLETLLDIPPGGLHVQPDRARGPRVVLRAVERDPFADMPAVRPAEPGSLSIRRPLRMGASMTGRFDLSLYAQHVVMIAASGAGKSMAQLTMAERETACVDAVVWDVDITGAGGLDELGGAIGRPARTAEEAYELLADAVAYAQVRPQLYGLLGRHWHVSAERPALRIKIDEFGRLPAECKALAKVLLEIGRKAAVTIDLATQIGTRDHLDFDIADMFDIKILMACRDQDIKAVLGPGFAAEGWRPDRLRRRVEGSDEPHDAGCAYVMGGGNHDPIIRKFGLLAVEDAQRAGAERTGKVAVLDEATIAAGAAHRAGRNVAPDEVVAARILAARLLELVDDAAEGIASEEAAARVGLSTSELAAKLKSAGLAPTRTYDADRNRVRGYPRDDLARASRAS